MGELRERGAIWWIRCYRNGRRKRTNVGDVTELAVSLPLWQRIRSGRHSRPQTLAALAEDLDAKVDTVKKAVQRHPHMFTRSTGKDAVQRIALQERRAS